MFPFFIIGSIRVPVFPFVLLFAFLTCGFTIFKQKAISFCEKVNLIKTLYYLTLFAFFGGKILSIISIPKYDNESLFDVILKSGFVFYGGLIGGIIGLFVFCKKYKLCFLRYSDIMLMILPLGQSIGRIGCFFNGCCYGKKIDGLISINYPINGQIETVFPTWFFESFFCFFLFFIQNHFIKNSRVGMCTSLYCMLYSIFRLYIECFRGDEIRGFLGSLSTSQVISIFVFLYGLLIYIKTRRKEDF